jgi:hypothetical protein
MPAEPHANGRHQQIFISFANDDRALVDHVVGTIESDGTPCWVSYRDIPVGDPSWPGAIARAIAASRLVVVVVSMNSVASAHVVRELSIADKKGIPFVPFCVDDAQLSPDFEYFLIAAQRLYVGDLPLPEKLEALRLRIRKRFAQSA